MGFAIEDSKKALLATGHQGIEAAVDWLLANPQQLVSQNSNEDGVDVVSHKSQPERGGSIYY